jgi:hypothetical protein
MNKAINLHMSTLDGRQIKVNQDTKQPQEDGSRRDSFGSKRDSFGSRRESFGSSGNITTIFLLSL